MFRLSSRLRACSLLRDSSSPIVVRQLFGILPPSSSLSPSAGRVSWLNHSTCHRPGRSAGYGKSGKIISTQHGAIVLLLPAITLSYGKRYFAERSTGVGRSAQASSSKFARWSAGAFVIPHPQKAWKGGEDAYFISENGKAVGVADGVGGWAEVGVDPSRYSKNLMAEAKKAVDELNVKDTTEILAIAAEASSHITGSSTALIVMLEGNLLLASNLGDSGVLVIRGGAVVYRSKEQQHSFNFPFQLGSESTDMPYHAERIAFPLEENDTVVVGTDGLLDNLFDQEIAEIVKRADEKSMNPQQIAKELAQQASQAANRKNGLSPFGQNALQHGYAFTGGKLDDITVVVAKPVVAS